MPISMPEDMSAIVHAPPQRPYSDIQNSKILCPICAHVQACLAFSPDACPQDRPCCWCMHPVAKECRGAGSVLQGVAGWRQCDQGLVMLSHAYA